MTEYIYGTDGHECHWLTGEEIVRCRDCRHIVWTDNPMTSTHYWCIEYDRPCGLDDFCSWAERRKSGGIESIYDWKWVREMVGEEEAERRKEQQREEELEELVRDAYWLIVRAKWTHVSQDKFAAEWTERVSVLGIEVD